MEKDKWSDRRRERERNREEETNDESTSRGTKRTIEFKRIKVFKSPVLCLWWRFRGVSVCPTVVGSWVRIYLGAATLRRERERERLKTKNGKRKIEKNRRQGIYLSNEHKGFL